MSPLHPALHRYLGIPGYILVWLVFLLGLGLFSYVIHRRVILLRSGQRDPRMDAPGERLRDLVIYGLLQARQPRYLWAGVIHFIIFWGFLVLALRSAELLTQGLNLPLLGPMLESAFGRFYATLKDAFEVLVLFACLWAFLRRAVLRPERYRGSRQAEAYLVLFLIAALMVTDMLYEGSALRMEGRGNEGGPWLPAAMVSASVLSGLGQGALLRVHHLSYWTHILLFFLFLNLLPASKHFHIITALPNVFLKKRGKGTLKPARWFVQDLGELDSIGVSRIEDLTWKHLLDLYTCTECGRCSENCPANAVGRPLSPKMLTIKLRDHAYRRYPLFVRWQRPAPAEGGAKGPADEDPMIGTVITREEIWSCTTCGACEEECPVFIEYIDKMVDMRRHLIETAQNPKTFNPVLMNVEKTGNPFGKPSAKRGDWAKEMDGPPIRIVKPGDAVEVLYFVDGYASYDPRIQRIAGAIAKGLQAAGIDFGILGPLEKDSGHQVRRLGEEGLFQLLMEENKEVLSGIRSKAVITTDPHAFNCLKKDYGLDREVYHYTQYFSWLLASGRLRPERPPPGLHRVTYHDPCYLGRHNGVYEAPRAILKAIPGIRLVEMKKARDRSFCCGGGDVGLWHEIEGEEVRMAWKRIEMAMEIGADTVVTACPFCLIHLEDAIKTGGVEQKIRAVDLMELLVDAIRKEPAPETGNERKGFIP